MYVTAL